MNKFIAFLKSIGAGIKWAAKQLWSLVADRQWDFDPYKVGGFGCIAAALAMGFRVFVAAQAGKSGTDLAVLAGLVGTIASLGTFLFNQARKSDDTLPKAAGLVATINVSGSELQTMVDKAKADLIQENGGAIAEKAQE